MELALLFGSQARGSASVQSDVDIAIQGEVDRVALGTELSQSCSHEVDVIDLKDAGYPLLKAIVRDGIVIHEGAPGSAARFRAHALADLDTDRVWFERMRDAWLARLAARGTDGRR